MSGRVGETDVSQTLRYQRCRSLARLASVPSRLQFARASDENGVSFFVFSLQNLEIFLEDGLIWLVACCMLEQLLELMISFKLVGRADIGEE